MRHLSPAKAAVSVGTVLGAYHLVWVTLVAIGVAKPFLDFILRLHFIKFDYTLAPFVVSTAVTLVAITFAIGAAFGLVFALVWNWLSRNPQLADESGKPALSVR